MDQQIQKSEIIEGDCLEVLKGMQTDSVDVVVTSPPYNTLPSNSEGSGFKKGHSWNKKAAEGYFDQRPEDEYQSWLREIVGHCIRVCKGLVWVNHKPRYRDGYLVHPLSFLTFPVQSEIIWSRECSMTLNAKRFAPSYEYIFAFGKRVYWNNDLNGQMSVWTFGQLERGTPGNICSCPFPGNLVRRLLWSSCSPKGLVLDPFLGGGTTAVVAKELGYRCIGIEQEKKFADSARELVDKAIVSEIGRTDSKPTSETMDET